VDLGCLDLDPGPTCIASDKLLTLSKSQGPHLQNGPILVPTCLSLFGLLLKKNIEWLKNNRNVFLTVMEARSLRSGCYHGWVLVQYLLPGWRMPTSYGVFTWQKES
jgi:hypothetical protein